MVVSFRLRAVRGVVLFLRAAQPNDDALQFPLATVDNEPSGLGTRPRSMQAGRIVRSQALTQTDFFSEAERLGLSRRTPRATGCSVASFGLGRFARRPTRRHGRHWQF